MQFSVNNGNGRRDYPAWNTRVQILAVDNEGFAKEGAFVGLLQNFFERFRDERTSRNKEVDATLPYLVTRWTAF
jgi:hypothetical protein